MHAPEITRVTRVTYRHEDTALHHVRYSAGFFDVAAMAVLYEEGWGAIITVNGFMVHQSYDHETIGHAKAKLETLIRGILERTVKASEMALRFVE